jgi:hypothetical protein
MAGRGMCQVAPPGSGPARQRSARRDPPTTESPVRLCDARRLDVQPADGVLACIGVVVDARSIDL